MENTNALGSQDIQGVACQRIMNILIRVSSSYGRINSGRLLMGHDV